jgi:hypothetical protein
LTMPRTFLRHPLPQQLLVAGFFMPIVRYDYIPLSYTKANLAQGNFGLSQLAYSVHDPDCRNATITNPVVLNAQSTAQYYPCGLIANSMFSDIIGDLNCMGACRIPTYTLSESGIAWPEDKSLYAKTKWATASTAIRNSIPTKLIPPPFWRSAWPEKWASGYNASNLPDLATWERFQVWMRPAALPSFKKLWGRNTTDSLDLGTYMVQLFS